MNIISVVGIGITAAAAAALLRNLGGGSGMFVSLAASLVILAAVITSASPLIGLIKELADEAGTQAEYIAILLKALAVCIITHLASEFCRDGGESAIASKVELAGRTAVLLVAVPLFREILQIVKGLIL